MKKYVIQKYIILLLILVLLLSNILCLKGSGLMAIQDYNQPYELSINTVNGVPVSIKIENETHVVYDSQIMLSQLPDQFYKVVIENKFEQSIDKELTDITQFKVDYKNCLVYVHPDLEGTSINIQRFYGKGIKYLLASRVKLEDLDNLFSSIHVEGAMKELAERLNNLINGGEQLSEVVDSRLDSNTFTTYPTLKNRLDIEFGEVYNARTNNNTIPVIYTNLKDRLDTECEEFEMHLIENTQQFSELDEQKANKTDLIIERARIDNLIATAGDGTIPSELSDIRVGANEITYTTAGESVRSQLSDKANKLVIKNIAPNPNFGDMTGVGWVFANNVAVLNNELFFIVTNPSGQVFEQVNSLAGHKYYIAALVKSPSALVYLDMYDQTTQKGKKNHSGSNQFELLSFIGTTSVNATERIRIVDGRSGSFSTIYVKQYMVVDLTKIFGVGNEPSLTYFEAMLKSENNNSHFVESVLSTKYIIEHTINEIINESFKPQIYASIENDILKVNFKYSDTKDMRVEMRKKAPNNIFDFSSFTLIDNSTDFTSNDTSSGTTLLSTGTDFLGPYKVKAVNNGDGDIPISGHFTGGAHGYNNSYIVAPENTPTGRTSELSFHIDGRKVTSFAGYCYTVDVYWTNRIQGYNTKKADGLGREILEEKYHLHFDGDKWHIENEINYLEDVLVELYYGLQFNSTPWRGTVYYHSSSNKKWNNATITSNSGSKSCNIITSKNGSHFIDMGMDKQTGLGNGLSLASTEFNAFTTEYAKSYFWFIENMTFGSGDVITFKGYYRFYSK
jgi:hypothetical protein